MSEKIIISTILRGNMKNHVLKRIENLGFSSRTEFIRKLIVEDMERQEDKQRPQINYFGSGYPPTTLPSDRPLPKAITSKPPIEMAGMMAANAEMAALIDSTGGNPQKALKKVIRVEG